MNRNLKIGPACVVALVFTSLLLASQTAQALFSIDLGDFNSPAPSIVTRNGDATLTNGILRLTPDAGSKNGSSFLNIPFDVNASTSFSTHFQFRIHGQRTGTGEGADGLVFIVQNDSRGTAALGTDGGGLGYGVGGSFGGPPIGSSIGIAFDTFPFQLSHQGNIQLLENGAATVAESLQSFDFASGAPLNAWIDYRRDTGSLTVYLSTSLSKPLTPSLTSTIALGNIVGSQAFFGFSAATGARFNIHDIDNWQLSYVVPEPSSALALLGGLIAVGWLSRSRVRHGAHFRLALTMPRCSLRTNARNRVLRE